MLHFCQFSMAAGGQNGDFQTFLDFEKTRALWDLFSLHASTVDSLRVLFLALFCKREEECSRGPHFLNLRSLRTH